MSQPTSKQRRQLLAALVSSIAGLQPAVAFDIKTQPMPPTPENRLWKPMRLVAVIGSNKN